MEAVPFKKINAKARQELIDSLQELITRVKNDDILLVAAVTLDRDDNVSVYHSRLQKASGLELIGIVDLMKDYLKDVFYGG